MDRINMTPRELLAKDIASMNTSSLSFHLFGLLEALERAERKLTAYAGVGFGDKELTELLPVIRKAIAGTGDSATLFREKHRILIETALQRNLARTEADHFKHLAVKQEVNITYLLYALDQIATGEITGEPNNCEAALGIVRKIATDATTKIRGEL